MKQRRGFTIVEVLVSILQSGNQYHRDYAAGTSEISKLL